VDKKRFEKNHDNSKFYVQSEMGFDVQVFSSDIHLFPHHLLRLYFACGIIQKSIDYRVSDNFWAPFLPHDFFLSLFQYYMIFTTEALIRKHKIFK
jgi:hypothetical protein